MNVREILQISAIVVLSVIVGIQFVLNGNDLKAQSSVTVSPESEELVSNQEQQTIMLDEPSNSLQKEQSDLTDLFRQVQDSVVQVTSKVSTVNTHIIINGNPLENQSTRLGSGFVYDKEEYIITNNHVVEGAQTVDVTFVDGNMYTAKVIGTDPYSDIAVLQIVDKTYDDLKPVTIGDSSKLEVGQQVIAIGNPFGLSNTMTSGIVSQTGRLLATGELGFSIPSVIQTDAAINPGNSGGPLLNLQGEVVGINTAIKSNTGDFAGIGFAIPSNAIKRIVPELIKDGHYSHPWLGISGTNLTPDIAESLKLPPNYKGVMINSLAKDGPAKKAGVEGAVFDIDRNIKGADVIVSIDGKPIREIGDIIFYIEEFKSVGDKVVIDVNRNGHVLELSAILQERS